MKTSKEFHNLVLNSWRDKKTYDHKYKIKVDLRPN